MVLDSMATITTTTITTIITTITTTNTLTGVFGIVLTTRWTASVTREIAQVKSDKTTPAMMETHSLAPYLMMKIMIMEMTMIVKIGGGDQNDDDDHGDATLTRDTALVKSKKTTQEDQCTNGET